ncbi:MAG: hypothetical protein J6X94_10750 [Lachnospiraceae bacterium]|nr:hypothetical protein [Lachnospiraceae bacterium]
MDKKKTLNLLTLILLIISIILISVGTFTGKVKETERKGNALCLECIGLG